MKVASLVLAVGLLLGSFAGPAAAGPGRHSRSEAVGLATAKVRIVDFAFKPRTIEISRGTTVKWTNAGSVGHTVTGKGFDSGTLRPGATFSRRFTKAGTFAYHCTIHSSMKGKIVVS